jgi:methionyl aminopeptidase
MPIYQPSDYDKLRIAGRIAAETLDYITPFVEAGATTLALNDLCHKFIESQGARPATVGYKGYQHASCISVNHVICHGIPSATQKLSKGDILSIDVVIEKDGWFGDTCRMYTVGGISRRAQKLIQTTYTALEEAIAVAVPGARLGDIGSIIEKTARPGRFYVAEDFTGHGIGKSLHEPPTVFHYGERGTGEILRPGMCFTIEPMLNGGTTHHRILKDGWTAITADRSLSAQFEHMVLITETGNEVLTRSPKGYTLPPHNT